MDKNYRNNFFFEVQRLRKYTEKIIIVKIYNNSRGKDRGSFYAR